MNNQDTKTLKQTQSESCFFCGREALYFIEGINGLEYLVCEDCRKLLFKGNKNYSLIGVSYSINKNNEKSAQ